MTTPDTKNWAISINQSATGQPQATLTVAVNGGAPAPTKLKGVCYPPPINGSTAAIKQCYGAIA
jgi:hypothetical protein